MRQKVEAAKVPYYRAGGTSRIDIGLVRDLRRIVDDVDADIVHSHGFKSDVYCSLALRSRSIPLVTTVHGWTAESLKVRLYERVQAMFWRSYDRVFAVSKAYLDTAGQRGVPASKLHLLYNGIIVSDDPEPVEASLRQQQRAGWGAEEGDVVVGSVGRLSAEKNHTFLLDVAATLRHTVPQCRFVIVGDGAQRESIEQKIRTLGIQDRVVLTGHVDGMAGVYRGLDILAINSLREGLPNVLLEAMLNRLPVVSAPVGGVPEVMGQGVGGVLTSGLNVNEFASAIQQLADDETLRARLGQTGRDRVISQFSFERRMDTIVAHYEQLLS